MPQAILHDAGNVANGDTGADTAVSKPASGETL
jgi:hypothetical protein